MAREVSVLWIEDGARTDLPYLAAPVYMDGRFELALAEDISEAVEQMLSRVFQAIIVDIRMPPGKDPWWIKAFQEFGADKVAARLGLELLRSLITPKQAKVKLPRRPEWFTPQRVGVLSIESQRELQADLEALGICAYQQKTAGVSYRVLLDLIEQVLAGARAVRE